MTGCFLEMELSEFVVRCPQVVLRYRMQDVARTLLSEQSNFKYFVRVSNNFVAIGHYSGSHFMEV